MECCYSPEYLSSRVRIYFLFLSYKTMSLILTCCPWSLALAKGNLIHLCKQVHLLWIWYEFSLGLMSSSDSVSGLSALFLREEQKSSHFL